MPATTPDGLPFPLRADKPAGAAQIEALANATQEALQRRPPAIGGVVTFKNGTALQPGEYVEYAVSFPQGAFSSPPMVLVSLSGNTDGGATVRATSITVTGALLTAQNIVAGAQIVRAAWLAVGS